LRYAWSAPLKDKTCKLLVVGLKTSVHNRKTNIIQSHKGTEFVNATVRQYVKHQGVDFHTTRNPDFKGAIIGGFNCALKTEMYKYFTTYNIYRYVDIISDLLAS
jgi:hypothetical protein